jgi:hypothetical protein
MNLMAHSAKLNDRPINVTWTQTHWCQVASVLLIFCAYFRIYPLSSASSAHGGVESRIFGERFRRNAGCWALGPCGGAWMEEEVGDKKWGTGPLPRSSPAHCHTQLGKYTEIATT